MKLSQFVLKSPEIERLRALGRNLGSQPTTPIAVSAPVTEAKKKIEVAKVDDLDQQKREYAIAQLEQADSHHHRHTAHKIKNFD